MADEEDENQSYYAILTYRQERRGRGFGSGGSPLTVNVITPKGLGEMTDLGCYTSLSDILADGWEPLGKDRQIDATTWTFRWPLPPSWAMRVRCPREVHVDVHWRRMAVDYWEGTISFIGKHWSVSLGSEVPQDALRNLIRDTALETCQDHFRRIVERSEENLKEDRVREDLVKSVKEEIKFFNALLERDWKIHIDRDEKGLAALATAAEA